MKMKKNLIDYELLWEKITDYAKVTGRTTARPVLLLYYVLRSPETPSSDKMLIVAALSYLVLPIDLISAKRLPIIGWIDEAVSLVYAYKVIGCKVQPFNRSQSEISMSSLINTHQFTLIELCFSYRITSIIRQASSFIIINIFTRISSCLTISIQISTGFQIMFMNGIYRSHGTNKTGKVTI